MGWTLEEIDDKTIIVRVPEVVGKQRARTVRVNGVTRSFTPKKTVDFEDSIRNAWIEQDGADWADFDGPVAVFVSYSRELAKSNPKFWAGRADTGKPDADNVLKSVLDALSGVAFADDAQVIESRCDALPRVPHGAGSGVVVTVGYYEETYEKE